MNAMVQSMLNTYKEDKATAHAHRPSVWRGRIRNFLRHDTYRRMVLAKCGLLPRNAQTVVETFWGQQMKVLARNPDMMVFDGKVDSYETKLTFFFIKSLKPDDVFYDIGSHFGYYSILASRFVDGELGEIHAFEPQPHIFAVLEQNIEALGRYAVSRAVALSDRDGDADFYLDPNVPGASTLLASVAGLRRHGAAPTRTTVRTTTLDHYIHDGHRPPTIMKVDVEGAELSVINGAERTLSDHRPIVTLELWQEYSLAAARKMLEYDYAPHFIMHNGSVVEGDLEDIKKAIEAGLTDNLVFKPKP